MESQVKEALFNSDQQKLLNDLLGTLSPQQSLWLGGYLTGAHLPTQTSAVTNTSNVSSSASTAVSTDVAVVDSSDKLKVLFGSRTGNSKKVATDAYNYALSQGIAADLIDMNDYNLRNLKKEKFVLVVVSTDGEGEPPLPAEELHEFVHGKKAPKIPELQFSVLGLGDSSYKKFCQTGKDFDAQLEALGGQRVYDRADCDLDFSETAEQWFKGAIEVFKAKVGTSEAIANQAPANQESANDKYTAKSPYKAEVLDKVQLNGKGSDKETLHVELSIEDSGLTYEPGDALSIISPNRKELVKDVLGKASIRPDSLVKIDDKEKTIEEALIHDYEITVLTRQVLESYSKFLLNDALDKVLADEDYLADFLYGRDLLDLLTEFPTILSANEFVSVLRKMQPRQYSIASSYNANPEEVHLTIAAVRYNRNDRLHNGKASTYLADQINEEEPLSIFINKNESFRLPQNAATPIIMIGPGTGVAPFRSFLQERELADDAGRSWLFFGDQHFTTDFLYQTEFQKFLKKGVLTQMDVAFSRDQEYKVYVQNKLEEKSREVFHWLQDGAHLYLCGDQNKMAKDVKKTLINIISKEGNMDTQKAGEYFKELRKSGRFQEDVY